MKRIFLEMLFPSLERSYLRIGLFALTIGFSLCQTLVSQEVGTQADVLAKLVHPDLAERLSLTDSQRARFQALLLDRSEAILAAGSEEARSAIRQQFEERAIAELTDDQKAKLDSHRPAQRLMFQFREMKWDQVLHWFAAQQELTLVMDRVPPGSFTYSDSRSYSSAEAIDLLNSILMTRGFTLVRREKMLMVVELSDSFPVELLPRVEIGQLPERGRFELVSVILPLDGRPVDAVINEVKPYLNSYGRILPLARGTQVMVIENAGKMQTINELIASVPIPKAPEKPSSPPGPVFAAYSIQNLEAAKTLETIRQLIPSENITINPETGVLSAFVVPAHQTAIKAALDAMIEKQSELPEMQAVAYVLKGINHEQFRDQIASIAPTARIMSTRERALVVASPADHPLIRQSLMALDILPIDSRKEVRNFEVPKARLSAVESALRTMIPQSQVASDPESGVLIVKGELDDLRTAAQMVELLSRTDDPVALKIYPLSQIQVRRRAIMGNLPDTLSELKLQDGNDGKELLVWGTQNQHSLFADFLKQLDQPEVPEDFDVPQVFDINIADSALVVELLKAEFEKAKFTLNPEATQLTVVADAKSLESISNRLEEFRHRLPLRPELSMVVYQLAGWTAASLEQALQAELGGLKLQVDPQQDRLLVWASAERHVKIQELMTALGEKLPVEQQKVVVVYTLQYASATAVKSVLDQLSRTASIVADEKLKQIVITGTIADQSTFQSVIGQIDRQKSLDTVPSVQAFDVGLLQASQILPALQSMWPDLKVSVETSANKIIATGSDAELQQLQKAIERLTDSAHGSSQEVKTYPVPFGEMSTLPAILAQIAPKSITSSDVLSRTITVLASPEQHERIRQALEQVVSTARGAKQAVSYVVRPAQTASVQTSIRTLLPSLAVTTDPVSGQLIVLASLDEHQLVAKIVELLSSGPNAEERSLQVFKLKPKMLSSPEFMKMLQSLVPPQVTLEPSSPTESLWAVGTPDDLQVVSNRVSELLEQWPSPDERTSAVYSLQHAATSTAFTLLQPMVPEATLVQDPTSRSIAATATSEDHQKIKELIDLLDLPAKSNQTAQVYRLKQGTGQALAYALAGIMPDARLFGDPNSGALLATASPQQHQMIQAIADEYGGANQNLETRVFSMRRADAYYLQFAVQTWNNQIKVAADRPSNSLIVTGPAEVLKMVEEVVSQVDGSFQGDQVTRFYPVDNANPTTLANALQASFPKATLAGDAGGGGLFVTATEQQHTEIQSLVEELNAQPSRLPSLKTFVVQHVTPTVLARSLLEAYGPRAAVRVTFSENARSVFVLGTREELKIADQLVQMLDVPESSDQQRRFQIFPISGMDGRSILETLETAFENEPERVQMRYDSTLGRLVVFATEEQLAKVSELVDTLAPTERSMQVLALGSLDAFVAREAIDSLFSDTPYNQSPMLTVDHERQQLLIRATEQQHEQIRSLLSQMGAPVSGLHRREHSDSAAGPSRSGSRVRVVSMPFHSERVLKELEQQWPRFGSNPIQVLNTKPESASTNSEMTTPTQSSATPLSQEVPLNPNQIPGDELTADEIRNLPSLAPPVIIVVGEQEWTLASDDTLALDQIERVLELIRSPRLQPIVETGNYSLYLLKRASATEMSTMLADLFRPSDTRGPRLSASMADLYRRIKIVADNRANALIVSGNVNDRRLVEELLGVLDSEELLGSLQQLLPVTIPLSSATVSQVYSILREIYRSQLTTSVTRRPMPIPEGVSIEVSSLLQQLNAQASSPVLTISTDEITNSLIVRAPVDLAQEIRGFVESLDEKTAHTPSRRVELIRLESTNTKSIEQALRRLLSK